MQQNKEHSKLFDDQLISKVRYTVVQDKITLHILFSIYEISYLKYK